MEARCSLPADEWHGVIVCIHLVCSLFLSGEGCVCACVCNVRPLAVRRELPLVPLGAVEPADLGDAAVNPRESPFVKVIVSY